MICAQCHTFGLFDHTAGAWQPYILLAQNFRRQRTRKAEITPPLSFILIKNGHLAAAKTFRHLD